MFNRELGATLTWLDIYLPFVFRFLILLHLPQFFSCICVSRRQGMSFFLPTCLLWPRRAVYHYIIKEKRGGNPKHTGLKGYRLASAKRKNDLNHKLYWDSTWARADKQDIPQAPANIHRWSSSVASIQATPRLGAMPSKTHRFRCFQRLHAPRMTREFKPFCTCPSTKLFTLLHQSAKHPSSAEGESSWSPNRLRRQNQKCLANTQVTNRWSIVSSFLITVRTKS